MQYNAIAPFLTETHLQITEVLDGDSIMVASIFNKNEKEIRLYGLDAPENKRNRKLREDERKARLAGEYLVYLGKLSTAFMLKVAPPGTGVTILTEENNFYDYYRRQLAYVILPDGSCLNEILLKSGFAKAEPEYTCKMQPFYDKLNFAAMQSKSGIYGLVKRF